MRGKYLSQFLSTWQAAKYSKHDVFPHRQGSTETKKRIMLGDFMMFFKNRIRYFAFFCWQNRESTFASTRQMTNLVSKQHARFTTELMAIWRFAWENDHGKRYPLLTLAFLFDITPLCWNTVGGGFQSMVPWLCEMFCSWTSIQSPKDKTWWKPIDFPDEGH